MTRVVLALGSNVGDRWATLRSAVRALLADGAVRVVGVSPVYETAPVGGPDQPDYLNAVLVVDTELAARDVLARAHQVEAAHGRRRPTEQRWGPRPLDVDVIAYDDLRCVEADLTLPHPRAHERAFVLAPWADVAPVAHLPGHGPVADLLARVGTGGVRRRDDLALEAPR